MNWGAWRDLYSGVAWKRLTPHEVDAKVSNGHEFQGVGKLCELLGTEDRRRLPATYILLSDDEDAGETVRSEASWYDARANQPHRSSEWRLYYPAAAGVIQARMRPGDLMVIAVLRTGGLAVLLAPQGSSREAQLVALFALDIPDQGAVAVKRFDDSRPLGFLAASIIDDLNLGSTTPTGGDDAEAIALIAEELLRTHPDGLPSGREVSSLVHQRLEFVNPVDDPDGALVRWIEAEAAVFRLWEDGLIARQLDRGFRLGNGLADVQGFRDFAMTLRQSRVSRAGGALEHHTARILAAHRITFDAQATTENRERPDFLFPGILAYRDPAYPAGELRMLAVKFTVKDRWRQVLNEAARIHRKHLLTMDPAMTTSTLAGMQASNLQPVVATSVQRIYPEHIRPALMSIAELVTGPLGPFRRGG